MHTVQYEAYKRWIDKWSPQIVYGASAVGPRELVEQREPTGLSDLPGGEIVRAF